ncbi:biotin--[acetyl-CoA-carboxylase] ligase [Pontiella agarivorans]|uniref:Biotin--[acetyl-CoA-carboxylase] ligase n=1 Tax=Pontiella agarivorans TaxID=3038953 RepID=A0ABU5MSH6_9BACT|nr:biotin--[acetyl-CoA-carboxylase] ligase [Pontiella agarivorans]MDZ8117154.1 biotin--[acetyl-CoA-carboxylase] ligase [Pontiella agarivorans]
MSYRIEWFDRLPSTNAYMKECFYQNSPPENGTVFATRDQTAGRGRSQRRWTSGPDTNLCFSLFVETDCPLIEVASSTMAAALGIADYLNGRNIAAAPKWPNDVLVGTRKICGILSERVDVPASRGIIVGIGLNVNMSSEEAAAIDRPATSMLIESGRAGNLSRTLEELIPFLKHWIEQWNAGGFSSLRNSWTEKAGPIGKPLKVHDGAFYKEGTLAGFGNHGELLLQTSQGLETIWSGDVS